MRSKSIIREILDGRRSPAAEARMVEQILQDPQLTDEMLCQHRLDLALRAVYGPQNHRLEAAVMASITGSSNDRLGQRTMKEIKRHAWSRQSAIRWWMMPMAAAAAVILGAGLFLHSTRTTATAPVAYLVSSADARWEGAVDPSSQGFTPGPWKLISGVAELRTSDGATVMVQAPSEFVWRSARLMNLRTGVLQATVPPQASGFTVQTAVGEVVDIGTRFGVSTGPAIPTETHVFDGHVQVKPNRSFGSPLRDLHAGDALALDPSTNTLRRFTADPSRFPQPSVTRTNLVVSGDWEPGDPKRVKDTPLAFGVWSGDDAEVIRDWKGVKPYRGEGMLRLTSNVSMGRSPMVGPTGNEQWQFVDLRSFADEINKGGVVAEASMWIRQVGGKPLQYRIFLAGFNVKDSPLGPGLKALKHPGITALSEGRARGEPKSSHWRQLRTRLELPPGTRFVYVNPRAEIGASPDPKVGVLIDSVELKLSIPSRAASGG